MASKNKGSIDVRLVLECPYHSEVVSLLGSATTEDFVKAVYRVLGEACSMGTRADAPEFSDEILKEFEEDEQPVPARGITHLKWPDLTATSVTQATLLGSFLTRRIPYSPSSSPTSTVVDMTDPLEFLPTPEPGQLLANWGLKDRDTLIISFLGKVRDALVTLPTPAKDHPASHRAVKVQCPFASYEYIGIVMAMYEGASNKVVEHLKGEYKVRRMFPSLHLLICLIINCP